MKRYILLLILFLALFAGRVAGQSCTLTSGAGTDNQTKCVGTAITNITYTMTGATGGSATGLPLGVNAIFLAPTLTISGTPTESGTFNYQVNLNDAGSGTCTSSGNITVNPLLAVSVSIVASANPVCDGTSVTYTATPVNGGGSPSYQWYNGATAVGSNSPAYSYTPANSDKIKVMLTSSETCKSGSPAPSNEITMTVNPVLPVSVSIVASTNPVCEGTSVTFTATPVNGGGTPSYQWYDGLTPVGTSNAVYSYTPANNDVIKVVLTSSATCKSGSPATSNTITMTVNPLTGTPVFTSGATEVCSSASDETYVATADNSISISYSRSPSSSGSINSSTGVMNWNSSFNGIATITATATGLCGTTTAERYVTVYSGAPSRPSAVSGNASVCEGQTGVSYSATTVTNATYYEWSVPVGLGATITSGQGTSNITVDFAPGASSQTISVKSGNPCGLSSSARNFSVEVRPTPTSTIDGTTTVCQGAAPPQITFYNPKTNAVTITYNINGADQTTVAVAGSNHTHINAPTTVAGTFTYTLVSVVYQTEAFCANIITGTATVTITPTVGTPTPMTISAGSDPACQLTNGTTKTTYTTTATNMTGFNWSLSISSAGTINSSGELTWTNGFSGSVDIQVTASGCNGPSSQVIRTVNITPTVGTPTAITVSGSEPTCQLPDGSTTTTYTTTATNSTGFNWSLSNSAAGSIGPSSGVMTWANGFSGSVDIQVTANGCNGPSSQVKRTVNITPNVGTPTAITVSVGSEPTCQLTNGTTKTTYAATATNSFGYNWSLSNALAGSINPTNGEMTWADGFSGNVNIQVTATGCNGNSSQVIRPVSITPAVGTPIPITLFAGSEPTCQLTSGTTMTIYSTTATNNSGFNWSLSDGAAGTINPSTGLMTWANGFSGNVDIRVTATGCGTSPQVTRTVTVNPLPVVTITGPATPRITSSGNIYETQTGMSGYSWAISGGGSGTLSGNTFTVAWNTGGNQTVNVNYIDTHGCTAINPTVYNVVVKPIPAASNASISGYPSVGNTLTGAYTYTDGSSGADNSTFRWLRNGTDPIPLATGTTYIPVMDDVNRTLTFEVTPVSTIGPPTTGPTIKSSPTELVEDLTGIPVADEVCIEGIRAAGNTIRGEYRYTFSKAEGISTYRWLRRDIASGTDFEIGTNRQYTLVASDIDDTKEIIFEVTPVSSNLTPIPGDPRQSNPLARILIPKTEYSVSEPDVILSANEPGGVFSGSGVSGNIFSPGSAGSSATPYILTYLLNIVNTSSSCSQQASKEVRVNPNVTSFVGFDPIYCHDSGQDVITVSGVPTDAIELTFRISHNKGIVDKIDNQVTIDPGLMRPGVNRDTLYFSYRHLGIFYRISKTFVIDSVGTSIRIINLDPAYCQGDPRKYVSVEGVYPAGGTAEWSGAILTDTKPASAFADPSLGTPGQTYPVSYRYKSPAGCYSKILTASVTINPLPNPSFSLNDTYNIDGGPVALVPALTGGTFSGRGVSGVILFPDIAGLGEDEIKYSITDNNKCSAGFAKKTIIRQAQGSFAGIPSVVCYDDTTYKVLITNLPTTGIVSITGFTSFKKTLVYTGGIAADYNVPAAGKGLDTLVFSYRWDNVDYTLSKAINIDSLGKVVIKNLTPGEIICDHIAPYELFPSLTGGVFTGPVSGGYLDPLKATRSDTVTYIYTNLKTGCNTSAVVPVTVYPSPKVSFAPSDVCIENDTDTTLFLNNTVSSDAVQSWLWEFTDAGGIKTSTDRIGGYLYKSGGLQKIALTATTVNNCAVTRETTFNLGIRPAADFYWKRDCMHPNDSIILVDTTFSISPVASRSWKVFGGAEFSTSLKNARYPKKDTGYIRIEYIVRTNYLNCIDTVIKDIYIRPTITIPADGYFEDFEAGRRGWVKGETVGNTWSFGTPDRPVIDNASSGRNAWFTGFDRDHPKIESSSIVSPCFDFRLTERPLIKLTLWRRFEKERDGAALQFRIGDSKEWQYVGTIEDGIEWYNSAVIRGEPGGNQLGWTTMGESDTSWVDAIHTLDELKGKKDVKFRIAYGSDGSYSSHDGIAFDDIWIGERSRNVLLEHFTNNSDNSSRIANIMINKIAGNRPEDVINIQYHTNFPGTDPYYNENPGDASARILFYGLIKAPYTFIDGGTNENFANIFDNPVKIDSNDVTRRSLIPARFGISLNPDISGGVLTVTGKITAMENINSDNLTLFIAVTEKENSDHAGANGETIFYNVFRKFIPDAGGISLKKVWTKGELYTIPEQTWLIGKIKNSADIEVIAFIQNSITKELYQAESEIKQNIVVGIENLFQGRGNDFELYPIPAVNNLTVTFKEPLDRDAEIRIYNLQGVVISEYKAGSGITTFNIEDLGLKGGIYLIRVTSGGTNYGFRKLIVTHD